MATYQAGVRSCNRTNLFSCGRFVGTQDLTPSPHGGGRDAVALPVSPDQDHGYSSCWGRSSRISCHGAFEPTNMCAVGLSAGSSTSDPYGTRRYMPLREVQYKSDRHALQRMAWSASASPITISESAPFVTFSFSRSISPHGKNAEPVI